MVGATDAFLGELQDEDEYTLATALDALTQTDACCFLESMDDIMDASCMYHDHVLPNAPA